MARKDIRSAHYLRELIFRVEASGEGTLRPYAEKYPGRGPYVTLSEMLERMSRVNQFSLYCLEIVREVSESVMIEGRRRNIPRFKVCIEALGELENLLGVCSQ